MKIKIGALGIAAAVAACVAFTPFEKKENVAGGWIKLFDGKTTKGWHKYNGGEVGSAWKVEDGAIHLDAASKKSGAEGGDILTDEEFDNFHLKYEWKISEKGNSGLIFYVHEDQKYGAPYLTGPEMQVVDNDGHPDGKLIKHQAGDLYDLVSSSKKVAKPVGQWNKAEIKSVNGKLDLYLNGVNVVSTTMWDDNWKDLISKSKFKDWADFGTFKKGKIDLQDHGDDVWFRNIMIKKL